MQDATLYAQEGVNTSAILCCLLESLSGNSLRNISGTYVVISSTAKGRIFKYLLCILPYVQIVLM